MLTHIELSITMINMTRQDEVSKQRRRKVAPERSPIDAVKKAAEGGERVFDEWLKTGKLPVTK